MKKYITLILCTITIFFSSCSLLESPELYEEVIHDHVKLSLAEALCIKDEIKDAKSNPFLLASGIDIGKHIKNTFHKFEELMKKTEAENCRARLECIANDKSSDCRELALKMCHYYDDRLIELSDYTLIKSSLELDTWTFTELHSGVDFILKIKTSNGTKTLECYPVMESCSAYLKRLLY